MATTKSGRNRLHCLARRRCLWSSVLCDPFLQQNCATTALWLGLAEKTPPEKINDYLSLSDVLIINNPLHRMREPRTVTPFLAAYMLSVPHVVEASKTYLSTVQSRQPQIQDTSDGALRDKTMWRKAARPTTDSLRTGTTPRNSPDLLYYS